MYLTDDGEKSAVSENEAASITMAKEAAKKFANQHPESQVFAKTAVKNVNASSKA